MSFLKKLWLKKKKESIQKPSMMMMESDTLGMTVIEQTNPNSQIAIIEAEEWVEMISNKNLDGFPYNRIYYSFLKGIPNFLRMKIWLLLCTQNSSKNYVFTGKQANEQKVPNRNSAQIKQKIEKKGIKIQSEQQPKDVLDIFTIEIFEKLSTSQPMQKQVQQIEKDIHRSFANKMKFRYTEKMLRKVLYSLSNSGVQYSQGMNYILLNIIIFCLQSVGVDETTIQTAPIELQRNIFIIMREIVLRLDEVFSQNNIFKVIKELQQKITETVPDVFYAIFKCGMDTFSVFSQNYFSLLTYNDPPEELCKQMIDLFFLEGQKAITSIIIRMLEISQSEILKIEDPQEMQKFLKKDMFHYCYKTYKQEKDEAKTLSDFGISFYQNVEQF